MLISKCNFILTNKKAFEQISKKLTVNEKIVFKCDIKFMLHIFCIYYCIYLYLYG